MHLSISQTFLNIFPRNSSLWFSYSAFWVMDRSSLAVALADCIECLIKMKNRFLEASFLLHNSFDIFYLLSAFNGLYILMCVKPCSIRFSSILSLPLSKTNSMSELSPIWTSMQLQIAIYFSWVMVCNCKDEEVSPSSISRRARTTGCGQPVSTSPVSSQFFSASLIPLTMH